MRSARSAAAAAWRWPLNAKGIPADASKDLPATASTQVSLFRTSTITGFSSRNNPPYSHKHLVDYIVLPDVVLHSDSNVLSRLRLLDGLML